MIECPECFNGSVLEVVWDEDVPADELRVVACGRCGGRGQVDPVQEDADYWDNIDADIREEQAAELRNEQWFEERGHYGRDYHEEMLWQYDRQIGGY